MYLKIGRAREGGGRLSEARACQQRRSNKLSAESQRRSTRAMDEAQPPANPDHAVPPHSCAAATVVQPSSRVDLVLHTRLYFCMGPALYHKELYHNKVMKPIINCIDIKSLGIFTMCRHVARARPPSRHFAGSRSSQSTRPPHHHTNASLRLLRKAESHHSPTFNSSLACAHARLTHSSTTSDHPTRCAERTAPKMRPRVGLEEDEPHVLGWRM